MKYLLTLTLLCFLSSHSYAIQINNTEALFYNVGMGGLGSGIGAVINKKPEEKTGKVFLKGFWQGSIGGALVFGSKKLVNEISIQEQLEYNWAAKLVNSAGTSIIENASSNRDFWEVWHFNIGFNRFEFHTKDRFRFQYKVMPVSLILTAGLAINSKPEWGLMLRSGEVIFSTDPKNLPNVFGRTLGTSVRIANDNLDRYATYSHEFIHIYQWYDYNYATAYFNKTRSELAVKSKFFKKLDTIFHWEVNGAILGVLYQIEDINTNCIFNNYFEEEAQFYSTARVFCNHN